VTSGRLVTKMGKACCNSRVGKEIPQKEEKMTIKSHGEDSNRSNNKRKVNAKENGRETKMSQEEFDKEMVELKKELSILIMLLEEYEEDQRYGWTLKKKNVRWRSL
jgi:hypothetical protein